MRSWWALSLFCCSCVGGQTGSPTSGAGDLPWCEAGADAATALGVRGEHLLAAYSNSWTLTMRRTRLRDSQLLDLGSAEVVVSVAPGLDDGRAAQCDRVATPVTVSLSANDGLVEIADGVLAGTLAGADVNFSSREADGKEGTLVSGSITFSPELTTIQFTVDGVTWTYGDAP